MTTDRPNLEKTSSAPAAAPAQRTDSETEMPVPSQSLPPLSRECMLHAVTRLCAQIRAKYVFQDVAEQMATLIHNRLVTGEYDRCVDSDAQDGGRELLATALTQDLRVLNSDPHLSVTVSSALLSIEEGDDEEEENGSVDVEEPVSPMWKNIELYNNGVEKAIRLGGNVGLLSFRYLAPLRLSGPMITAAFTMLSSTSSLILDLRKCGGGDGYAGDFVLSYLVSGKIHANTTYWRPSDSFDQSGSVAWVPGPRYLNRPVYVLISSDTFSCAEKLAGTLRVLGRAVVIGQTTRGGGHPCTFVPIDTHLLASISIGKTTSEITGRAWEGVGIRPHVPCDADEALDVAHSLALRHSVCAGLADATAKNRFGVEVAKETTAEVDRLAPLLARFAQYQDLKPTREKKEEGAGAPYN
ncbi:ClpP/crotonase-like domain-containing protein [Powellomyces hirtus]|nr:ClpP/crotonase-like domain-containing protein [Powellomyces hirtus]